MVPGTSRGVIPNFQEILENKNNPLLLAIAGGCSMWEVFVLVSVCFCVGSLCEITNPHYKSLLRTVKYVSIQ